MMKKILILGCLWLLVSNCSNSARDSYSIIEDWMGREIVFPVHLDFVSLDADTTVKVNMEKDFKILTYWDAEGCLSCKLQLAEWKQFIRYLDHRDINNVQFLFFFAPQNKEGLLHELRINRFDYPMNIDRNDSLEILNSFPKEIAFQTFLLDKDNKVLAIGNPVLNPKVKDLYLRIIRGESPQAPSDAGTPVTTVSVSSAEADLGTFPWQDPRTCTFTLRNTGDRPLVIHDVTTSCGCLTVDYPEEPARPGEELTLRAHYRADSRGTVLKSMQVYCNAQGSPLRLRVTGTAE